MDNLAHSCTAVIVGSTLLPEKVLSQKKKLFLASILIANLPDVDFLLSLFGKKVYLFHHRGLTHSLLGLCLMLPLSYFIFSKIMSSKDGSVAEDLSRAQKVFFVTVQLLFTHFFLDYLTTYGTMFLYPFSKLRFSYPLMFIVDPVFWLITGTGAGLLYFRKLKSQKQVLKYAWLTLFTVFALWGGELFFKLKAENIFSKESLSSNLDEEAKIYSYPGPFAPFYWLLLEERELKNSLQSSVKTYKQAALSLTANAEKYVYWQENIDHTFEQGQFCSGVNFSVKARLEFEKFEEWGEQVVCSPFKYEQAEGCRCLSLKYSLLASGVYTFGIYWISEDGEETRFLLPDRVPKMLNYLQTFFPSV